MTTVKEPRTQTQPRPVVVLDLAAAESLNNALHRLWHGRIFTREEHQAWIEFERALARPEER